jgi:hypothetical protein
MRGATDEVLETQNRFDLLYQVKFDRSDQDNRYTRYRVTRIHAGTGYL